ncbi:MAG TPA: methyltransferase domain-containing protein [Actinomycetota bacterium]|nr:methyltransferase domain-containing protein [Actinomycetota bacterium]
MTPRNDDRMREYWDERARLNAAWYVDTSLSYEDPDMQRFFDSGRRIVDEALESLPSAPPGTSLAVDIGSGLGRLCVPLAERFDRVVGIDISSEMVERARSLVHNDRIEFLVGDGTTLRPIGDATADLVFTFTVFQHIPRISVIEGYIEEVGRILRPGGVFVFQWNNTPGSVRWAIRRAAFSVGHRAGVGREPHGRNDPNFLGSRVSLGRIRRALRRGGMSLERTQRLGQLFAWAWAVRSR